MKLFIALALLLLFAILVLAALRWWDLREDRAEWQRLAALQPEAPQRFSGGLVAHLPEPARRYFSVMIEPGAPLLPVAEIEMTGQFSLGNKDNPAYQPMAARQILAAPDGFVWFMRTRGSLARSGGQLGGSGRRHRAGDCPPRRSEPGGGRHRR